MYDFHDYTDTFVNPSSLPFCAQKAPWISFKNRYLGAKSCVWPSSIQNSAQRPYSYNTHLKHWAYVHYKICPKMSVELWKSYIVQKLGKQRWERRPPHWHSMSDFYTQQRRGNKGGVCCCARGRATCIVFHHIFQHLGCYGFIYILDAVFPIISLIRCISYILIRSSESEKLSF